MIEINNCKYEIHPIYDLYGADKEGNIINIVKKVPMKGHKNNLGMMMCVVNSKKAQKATYVHLFIWECYNGCIPKGKVVDHINNIKDDNRLSNLQLITKEERC